MPTRRHTNNEFHWKAREQIRVLHVEDSVADVHLITEQIKQNPRFVYEIENARTLKQACAYLEESEFTVIILDLSLPDCMGLDTLKHIRNFNQITPIIVLTGSYDDDLTNEIVRFGAQDYIHKDDFNFKVIERTIRYAIERKKTELELEQLTQYDPLTQLANRAIFMDRLKHAIDTNRRNREETSLVCLLLDLDNFKDINDSMGHSVGDALLIQVANRLQGCVRESDTVARLGGDEFAILLENIDALSIVNNVTNKILASLAQPFHIDHRPVFSTVSIGVANCSSDTSTNAINLLKNADVAMYTAKKKGGNQSTFFTRELQVTAQIRNNLERNLRKAISQNEFQLHYQPQIDIQNNKIYGVEALLRWQHPDHGIIPPNSFIPTLEDTGLIVPATEWIIDEALAQRKQWVEAGIIDESTRLSINISPKFFRHHRMHETIISISDKYHLDHSSIELELTESAFMGVTPKNLELLEKLRESGFRLSIDDFGTGYSSLSYIRAYPVDCIKLDRAFIKDIVESPRDAAITETIIHLCERLDMELIAEGVDSLEKLELLKDLNCPIVQGFYFSKPLPVAELKDFFSNFS